MVPFDFLNCIQTGTLVQAHTQIKERALTLAELEDLGLPMVKVGVELAADRKRPGEYNISLGYM